jgi:hypothetical protein
LPGENRAVCIWRESKFILPENDMVLKHASSRDHFPAHRKHLAELTNNLSPLQTGRAVRCLTQKYGYSFNNDGHILVIKITYS